jgi:putative SOS response-associated peptidase YedK
MCGRIALTHTWEELVELYNLVMPGVTGDAVPPPRYNIAPTQPIFMVDDGPKGRMSTLVRWGLVPLWVKDPGSFTLLVNARSETVVEKPSFRSAMRHRRTLVPATGFYEWRRSGKKSQAFWVRPRDGGILTIAGLMETWSNADGSEIDTGCLLTTKTNKSFAKIHHRLPVIVAPGDFERWLDCRTQEPRDVVALMRPVDDDYLEAIPVSDLVNKVSNAGPDIQVPVLDENNEEPKKPDDPQFSLF